MDKIAGFPLSMQIPFGRMHGMIFQIKESETKTCEYFDDIMCD